MKSHDTTLDFYKCVYHVRACSAGELILQLNTETNLKD